MRCVLSFKDASPHLISSLPHMISYHNGPGVDSRCNEMVRTHSVSFTSCLLRSVALTIICRLPLIGIRRARTVSGIVADRGGTWTGMILVSNRSTRRGSHGAPGGTGWSPTSSGAGAGAERRARGWIQYRNLGKESEVACLCLDLLHCAKMAIDCGGVVGKVRVRERLMSG